jgi:hypothetical protein
MSGPVIVLDGKISKFPYPLFPKFKHPYSLGFRLEVMEQVTEFILDFELPSVDMELVEITFTASGYNDGDFWSLVINDQYVLNNIYTKEVGQVKPLKVIKSIPSGSTQNKFIFSNVSGQSKIIWIDLDFTCKEPIQYV